MKQTEIKFGWYQWLSSKIFADQKKSNNGSEVEDKLSKEEAESPIKNFIKTEKITWTGYVVDLQHGKDDKSPPIGTSCEWSCLVFS